jgi:hypothetical protein
MKKYICNKKYAQFPTSLSSFSTGEEEFRYSTVMVACQLSSFIVFVRMT